MKQVILVLVFFAISAKIINGQIPQAGSCPTVKAMRNLSIEDYVGTWYEAEKYTFVPEILEKCISIQYDQNDDNTINTQIKFTDIVLGTKKVYPGLTHFLDPIYVDSQKNRQVTGNLQLTLTVLYPDVPTLSGFLITQTYPYKIVATDYTTYAIKFSCRTIPKFPLLNLQSVWILSRDPTYPQVVQAKVHKIMRSLGLNVQNLIRTDQNCPLTRSGVTENNQLD